MLPLLFSGADNPQNCTFPLGHLHSDLMLGSLGLPESAPERHLDRSSRFCRAYERDQQTDRKTDRYYRLTITAMRPKKEKKHWPEVYFYQWPLAWTALEMLLL